MPVVEDTAGVEDEGVVAVGDFDVLAPVDGVHGGFAVVGWEAVAEEPEGARIVGGEAGPAEAAFAVQAFVAEAGVAGGDAGDFVEDLGGVVEAEVTAHAAG